jgi:transcription elongation factor Elf1
MKIGIKKGKNKMTPKYILECPGCGYKTSPLTTEEILYTTLCPNCNKVFGSSSIFTQYKPKPRKRKRAGAVVVDLPNYCPGCGARWANFAAADMIPLVQKFNGGALVACLACGLTVKKAGAA